MSLRATGKSRAAAAPGRRPLTGPPDRPGGHAERTQAAADRLHSLVIHLLRWLRAEDEALVVSGARLSALSVVVLAGPVSLGDLARAEQVRPPSMTLIVRALETAGLVRRRIRPDDRRGVLVEATPAGDKMLQHGRRLRVGKLAGILKGLSGRDLGELERSLELLRKKLDGGRAG